MCIATWYARVTQSYSTLVLYALAMCFVPMAAYTCYNTWQNHQHVDYYVSTCYSFVCSGAATLCAYRKATLLLADGRLRPRYLLDREIVYELAEFGYIPSDSSIN